MSQSRHYYETIPSTWDWSMQGRLEVERVRWPNQAHATVYRSKANVKISYGNTNGAAGLASRIAVIGILTHELGHVFGYGTHGDHLLADARRPPSAAG